MSLIAPSLTNQANQNDADRPCENKLQRTLKRLGVCGCPMNWVPCGTKDDKNSMVKTLPIIQVTSPGNCNWLLKRHFFIMKLHLAGQTIERLAGIWRMCPEVNLHQLAQKTGGAGQSEVLYNVVQNTLQCSQSHCTAWMFWRFSLATSGPKGSAGGSSRGTGWWTDGGWVVIIWPSPRASWPRTFFPLMLNPRWCGDGFGTTGLPSQLKLCKRRWVTWPGKPHCPVSVLSWIPA